MALVCLGDLDGGGRHLGRLGGVLGDLLDAGAHLLGAGGHGGCTFLLTCSAAAEATLAWCAVSSALAAICWLTAVSSSLLLASDWAFSAMLETLPRRSPKNLARPSTELSDGVAPLTVTSWVRSPLPAASTILSICRPSAQLPGLVLVLLVFWIRSIVELTRRPTPRSVSRRSGDGSTVSVAKKSIVPATCPPPRSGSRRRS